MSENVTKRDKRNPPTRGGREGKEERKGNMENREDNARRKMTEQEAWALISRLTLEEKLKLKELLKALAQMPKEKKKTRKELLLEAFELLLILPEEKMVELLKELFGFDPSCREYSAAGAGRKGKLEIRIRVTGGKERDEVQKCIEEARQEYPEAEIYVEWMV